LGSTDELWLQALPNITIVRIKNPHRPFSFIREFFIRTLAKSQLADIITPARRLVKIRPKIYKKNLTPPESVVFVS
jgi:hypothetical protein